MESPRIEPDRPVHLVSSATARRTTQADARTMAIDLARMLHDDKCEAVTVLDVGGTSPVTDFVVIASGTSDRQMNAVLDHAIEFGDERGLPATREQRDERSTWLLADFVDVVLHLFEPNTRAHYDIEGLFAGAEEVTWARPDQVDRNRAGLRPDER